MKLSRSLLPVILLGGMSLGMITVGIDCWNAATQSESSGIERIIELDREHFRSMQPVWDDYEDENPGWQRPEATSEATYELWRQTCR